MYIHSGAKMIRTLAFSPAKMVLIRVFQFFAVVCE